MGLPMRLLTIIFFFFSFLSIQSKCHFLWFFFFLYQTACAVLFRVSLNLFDGGLMSSIKWMHIHQFRSNEIQTQTQTEKKKTYTYKSKHKISNKKKNTNKYFFFYRFRRIFHISIWFRVCVCVSKSVFIFHSCQRWNHSQDQRTNGVHSFRVKSFQQNRWIKMSTMRFVETLTLKYDYANNKQP